MSLARAPSAVPDDFAPLVTCAICLDPFTDAHCVGTCGHTFCHACASRALEAATVSDDDDEDEYAPRERTARCPTCSSTFTERQLVPNAAVNAMVEAMKRAKQAETERQDATAKRLELDELTPLVKSLGEKHRGMVLESRAASRGVLQEFLMESRRRKTENAAALERELQFLDTDIAAVRREIEHLAGTAMLRDAPGAVGETRDKEMIGHAMEALGVMAPRRDGDNDAPVNIDETKRRKVLRHFNDLQSWYSKRRCDGAENNSSTASSVNARDTAAVLDEFSTLIGAFNRYSKISVAAEISEPEGANSSTIVSSIEFDSTQEHFATAGVSKRIQVYNLARVLEGKQAPEEEIMAKSKLSCLSYNKFIKHHLAASDYEGVVSLWDVERRQVVAEFEEHEKRIWTVDYCRTDPRLLVSGSDDYLVKIWNTDQSSSVHEIDMKANVCCAQYSPENAHCIAVGCVDHKVYLFDLRKINKPVQILSGHRKAVSYVKYLNANQIASASTDSTINVWNVNTGELTCALKGHMNEKNFVGLTVAGDHIACGSETNEVYIYHKELSSPITSVNFAGSGVVEDVTMPRAFISAATWKSDDSVLVAANSTGMIKVLAC
jgi:E3 ubiquitin-protein ligase RFWD2|uniref:RING-type domain-containing protein n=1 Tax=Ostreococcus mediterraneus TaxID=1486918 RepID=A0A6U0DRR8_9CHLO|mmetsp:Transcript_136/g.562  ORF Transcript_136/g.562 Transcript_136/m.562 type:complete len:607 (+) Transcript_136:201-2021(+)